MSQAADQEWLYRRIVEESQIGILYADREGLIRLWNAGAEAMFGFRAEEVLGKSMDLIIPERAPDTGKAGPGSWRPA